MTEQTARRVAAEPTITAETSALIRRLTAIQPGEHRVLSCYIRLESRDRVRDNYLIAFKDAMKALRADRPESTTERPWQPSSPRWTAPSARDGP